MKYSLKEEKFIVNILEKYSKFANNSNDIILNIQKLPWYNDEPKIFSYSVNYKNKYGVDNNIASGFSFNKKIALIRALGETAERYCIDNYSPRNVLTSSIKNIKIPHLDPLSIVAFSKNQLKKSSFKKFRVNRDTRFKWVTGVSLTEDKIVSVPSQLITINNKKESEAMILNPISTGAAAGLSLSNALYRGICEIIERDGFMISYLNKLPMAKIDLLPIKNKTIRKFLEIFYRYNLELVVLDITTDLGVPSFAALTLDRTGLGPAVSVGLKAGLDNISCIIGAVEESLMTRSWLRDKFIYNNPDYKREDKITNIVDRAHLWFPIKSIKYLDFWLGNKKIKKIGRKKLSFSTNQLVTILKILKKRGMEVVYVNITHPKIKKHGIVVIKAFISKSQPLYLDERYPYLGGNRLYEVPVKLGFLKVAKQESQLNKIPHPFL
ncbi:MAG: YcaO-like family protein [bacterium]